MLEGVEKTIKQKIEVQDFYNLFVCLERSERNDKKYE